MKKGGLIWVVLLVLLAAPVLAMPPFTQISTGDYGLEVRYPPISTLKVSRDYNFHVHVFNASNGQQLDDTFNIECVLHVYNSSGNHVVERWDNSASHLWDYSFNIPGENISTNGMYSFIVQCISEIGDGDDQLGGFSASSFAVTTTGEDIDESDDSSAGLAIVLFILAVAGAIFAVPFVARRLVQSESTFVLVKSGCWIIATWLMMLNAVIVSTIAASSGLDLTREMFFYMFGFGIAGFLFTFYLVVKLIFDLAQFNKDKKQRRIHE